MPIDLHVRAECWPIAGAFTISRGAKTEAIVVVAELRDGPFRGRGECVPYARYGESAESVIAAIEGLRADLANGLDRTALQSALPAGAARNALDCALWDLDAKRRSLPVHRLIELDAPRPVRTAFTLSLDTPERMADAAKAAAGRDILKVKLGADGDPLRLRAIRAAVPQATLIVDANEGWRDDNLAENIDACAGAGVRLIEQPLPTDQDFALRDCAHAVPICADESCHDRGSLAQLRGKYDAINIKLDKTGGLTEALALAREAEQLGFKRMIGCMVATSLAMAPALLLASRADFIDLDGPLLLARDREHGLRYENNVVYPPDPELWG